VLTPQIQYARGADGIDIAWQEFGAAQGATAYVTNENGSTVSVIDTTTNTVAATVAVGTEPYGIAIAPHGTSAYVANADSNTVSVIDTATNSATRSIAVRALPAGIAITPGGATAYVVDNLSGRVSIIVTTTGKVARSIRVGTRFSEPDAVAITPDQAPVAHLSVSAAPAGRATAFDASASTVAYGTIAKYAWNFGDGSSATTTTPTTTHTYASAGTFSASVTETSSAGTSMTNVFTGQTMSRNGGASARATATFTVG
jgi:YVTN family beta-propeller protein